MHLRRPQQIPSCATNVVISATQGSHLCSRGRGGRREGVGARYSGHGAQSLVRIADRFLPSNSEGEALGADSHPLWRGEPFVQHCFSYHFSARHNP